MRLQLTDRIVRLISKRDRQELGLKTQDEVIAAAEVKSERDLHRQIANVLRLRGIEFVESRMDKRSTVAVGTPDFLFSISYSPKPDKTAASLLTWAISCAWEIKMPGRQLDPDQEAMFKRMTAKPNGWRCQVVHSVDEALAELRRLGLP